MLKITWHKSCTERELDMKLIAITSKNPVKIQASKSGFQKMFPQEVFRYELISASSDVSDQPASDEETFRGALNRAQQATTLAPDSDYWVGIEGGVQECAFSSCVGEMMAFAWVVILSKEESGMVGKGRTASFFLPEAVIKLIKQGMELGEADDAVFGRSNSKQENGAVGILTQNVIDRSRLYEQAVILALIPFCNQELYI